MFGRVVLTFPNLRCFLAVSLTGILFIAGCSNSGSGSGDGNQDGSASTGSGGGSQGDFASTGSLITARTNATATVLNNGNVLCAGGEGTQGVLASAELYNPATGSFAPTGSLITARQGATATLLDNGNVLIAGGVADGDSALASAEIYNPTSGTFLATGNMNEPRENFTATLVDGEVLVAGGTDPGGLGSLNSAELYNPSTGTFTLTGNMTVARSNHTATLLALAASALYPPGSGEVLVAGGGETSTSTSTLATAEIYNPIKGTFEAVGNLNVGRAHQTATLLNNSGSALVLIAGGSVSGGGETATAELYGLNAGIINTSQVNQPFAVTGSLIVRREFQTATLLNNGMVLIVGGNNGSPIQEAELYDPTTGIFSATAGTPTTARSQAVAVLLSNGKVLIAGGSGSSGIQSSAELYTPSTLIPAGLTAINVTPGSTTVTLSGTKPFVAAGSLQNLLSVTWRSSNTAVVSISNDASNSGTAFAAGAGSATVTACTGPVCGTSFVNVP